MARFPQYKNSVAPDLSNLIALQTQGTSNAFNSLANIGNTIQNIQQKNIERANRNLLAQGILQGLNNDPSIINTINQAVNNSDVPLDQLRSLAKIRDDQIKNQQNIFNQKQQIDMSKKSATDLANQDPNSIFFDNNTPASPNLIKTLTDANATVTERKNILDANNLLSSVATADPYTQRKAIQDNPNVFINSNTIPLAVNAQDNADNKLTALKEAQINRDIEEGKRVNPDDLNPKQFAFLKSLEDSQTLFDQNKDLKTKLDPSNYSPTQTYTSTNGETLDKLTQFDQYISQAQKSIDQSNLPLLTKNKELLNLDTYKNKFIKDLAKEQINKGNIVNSQEAKKLFPKLSDKEINKYINDAKANSIIYTSPIKQTPGSYGYNVEVATNDSIAQINQIKNSNSALYDFNKFTNTTEDIKKVGKTEIKQKLVKDFKKVSGITDTGIEESLSDVKDAYKAKQLEDKTLPPVTDEEILAVLDINSSYDGYIWDKYDGQTYNDQQTNILNKLIAFKKPENSLLYKNIQNQSKILDNNIKSIQQDIDGLLLKLNNMKEENPLKNNIKDNLRAKVIELENYQNTYKDLYSKGN